MKTSVFYLLLALLITVLIVGVLFGGVFEDSSDGESEKGIFEKIKDSFNNLFNTVTDTSKTETTKSDISATECVHARYVTENVVNGCQIKNYKVCNDCGDIFDDNIKVIHSYSGNRCTVCGFVNSNMVVPLNN